MNNWFLILTSGSNTWAPLEGTLASPSAGSVRLVGQAPTLTRSEGEIDGGGEIAEFVESNLAVFYDVLGYVTSDLEVRYQLIHSIRPSVGALRLVGQQPTVAELLGRSPASGLLRLVGQVPTVVRGSDVSVSPDSAAVVVAGQQPTTVVSLSVDPTSGALRFIGQIPYLQPLLLWPESGAVRFTGQAPEINRIVAPSAGTLRFEGWGTVYREITVTYTLFDSYVTSDLLVRWQRAGGVTSDFTASYQVYGRVVGIRVSGEQNRILVDAPTLPTIRAMPVQKRIYAQRAA